jgi:hypothetical protein
MSSMAYTIDMHVESIRYVSLSHSRQVLDCERSEVASLLS